MRMGAGMGAGVGRVDGVHCEVTEEDEKQVRELTRRLALHSGGEASSSSRHGWRGPSIDINSLCINHFIVSLHSQRLTRL